MPTYEYVCLNCQRHTEIVQSFSDEPLRECPHCGGPLKRVFHPVGIVLKGSGFYSTDNRGSRSKAAPAEPKKESGTESKTSGSKTSEPTGGDKKPAAASGGDKKPAKSDGGSKT